MTYSTRRFPRTAPAALLAIFLTSGCAALRTPPSPAAPPAGQFSAVKATRTGFQAVYEGEMRIWFHSFQTIWYVAVSPAGTSLSAAVLSPAGIKIMQMHGTRAAHSCAIAMPAADRLKPYGEALWTGLLWSLADDFTPEETRWVHDDDRVSGEAERDTVSVRYSADSATGEILGKTVTDGRRLAYEVKFGEERREPDRSYPGLIRLRCKSPRCNLTLRLKSLHWTDSAGGSDNAPGR